ncbi:MAG: hypothetical protein K8R31_09515 [Bacteroidales bacterium]|nr:hypothetical protein [Bacteroidales bacterium]
MSKQKHKSQAKKIKKDSKTKDFFDKMDQFFDSKGNVFFWISMFFTLLFSFLLFNFRVSEAGDDSAYIFRAFEFVKEFKYPSFQGPLYPIFLSLFVWIFGLNITLLKSLSLISIIFHLYFFYKAFKGNVSGFLLIYVMIIISFNSYILYYASQTFNEAFFMLLQSIMFYYFFKFIINKEKVDLKNYVILGLLIFLIGTTKTIGYSIVLAVLVYFVFDRKWKGIAITLVSFLGFWFILKLIKTHVFGIGSIQFESQLNTLLRINSYDASEGLETFSGFLKRFLDNSKLYLSKHLLNFLGLKSDIKATSLFFTFIIYIIFFVSVFFSFKKNKYLFFTGLYLLIICGATFFMLQTRWDQDRLILVYFPLILLFLLSGIYYLGKINSLKFIKVLLPILFIIIFFTNLNVTTKKVKANDEYLMQNLAGNKFYGMTPDWVNYIKMSQWAAENVSEDVEIACRKPSISFVYAKRKFTGIYRIESENPDTLIANLKKRNVHYVIMGSLRKYPNQKTQYTINTVQRYLYYIQTKYPQAIVTVNRIGVDEIAYLFKIDYDKAK